MGLLQNISVAIRDSVKALARSNEAARDPKQTLIKRIGMVFLATSGGGKGGRKSYETANIPFEDIEKVYNTDGYVRQALDKYTELIFKAGYDFVGKNQAATEYIQQRMRIMEYQSRQPIDAFLIEVAENLVKYANVFILKAPMKNPIQGVSISMTPIPGNSAPIGAYFVLPVKTVRISRDATGNIQGYQQNMGSSGGGGQPKDWKADDIIHIYYKRETGYAWGTPFLVPVLEDVRLLREIEDNVARLVYRHLHPLYQYKVGLAQPGYEATDSEIEALRAEVESMPTDAAIVTPERHDIKAIGAEGAALDVKPYLEHFERRVFTGLGVSETQMGRGDTANRGTADNLTTEMHDRVKALQKVLAMFFNAFIIGDLLAEGGFDPLSNPDDRVELRFKEIALDEKIKLENHAVQMFTQNAIAHAEMRNRIGEDAVTDFADYSFNLITIPVAKATADAQAQAAADKAGSNKDQPANQTGKKPSPKKTSAAYLQQMEGARGLLVSDLQIDKYTSILQYHYHLTQEDVINKVRQAYVDADGNLRNFSVKDIGLYTKLTHDSMVKEAQKYYRPALLRGIEDCRSHAGVTRYPDVQIGVATMRLDTETTKDIDRLLKDIERLVESAIKLAKKEDAVAKVVGAFAALNYRVDFIARSQLMHAYNYGYALAAKALEYTECTTDTDSESCEDCKLRSASSVVLAGDIYRIVPPWHPNCFCSLRIKKEVRA